MRKTTIILILIVFVLWLVIITRITGVALLFRVTSGNMMPSYYEGSHICLSASIRPSFKSIIYFREIISEKQTRDCYLSRLVAFEGDTVEINDGYLLRNGMISDIRESLIFNYFIKRNAIYDFKILERVHIPPILQKDTVFLTITNDEYKMISRYFILHKIFKTKELNYPLVHSNLNHNNLKGKYGPRVVPKGYCFVLGDNRSGFSGLPTIGLVSIKNIIASSIFKQ